MMSGVIDNSESDPGLGPPPSGSYALVNSFAGAAISGLSANWRPAAIVEPDPAGLMALALNFPFVDRVLESSRELQGALNSSGLDLVWINHRSGRDLLQIDRDAASKVAGCRGFTSKEPWGSEWESILRLSPKLVVVEHGVAAVGEVSFERLVTLLVDRGYVCGVVVLNAADHVPHDRARGFLIAADRRIDVSGLSSFGPIDGMASRRLIAAVQQLPVSTIGAWRWWKIPKPVKTSKRLIDLLSANETAAWDSRGVANGLLTAVVDHHRRYVEPDALARDYGAVVLSRRSRQGRTQVEVRADGLIGNMRAIDGGAAVPKIATVHDGEVRTRRLDAREAARLMGLPDSFRILARQSMAYAPLVQDVVAPMVAHLDEHLLSKLLWRAGKNAK